MVWPFGNRGIDEEEELTQEPPTLPEYNPAGGNYSPAPPDPALGKLPALARTGSPYLDTPEGPSPEEQSQMAPFGMQPGTEETIDRTQLQGYVNPRRQLWSGVMMDIASHFLNGRQGGFENRGTTGFLNAIKHNQGLEMAERQRRAAAAQAANPYKNLPQDFQNYKLAQNSGYEGSFDDFFKYSKAAQSKRPFKAWTNSETGNLMYLDGVGNVVDTGHAGDVPTGLEIEMVGDVPYVTQTLPGGRTISTELNEWQQAYRRGQITSENRTEVQAKNWAAIDTTFKNEMPLQYNTMERQRNVVKQLIADIESGRFSEGGYIEGRWKPMVDREMAYLASANTRQTLENLKIVNLAPVTENEFAKLSEMYASVLRDPEANLGVLQENLDFLNRAMQGMEAQLKWFGQNETMEGYGMQRWLPVEEPPGGGGEDEEEDPVEW